MNLSNSKEGILVAVEKGYTIDFWGNVTGPEGRHLSLIIKQPHKDGACYHRFSVKRWTGRRNYNVLVHQFQAYFKYGEALLKKGVQVRHLNGDSLNNSRANVVIGSQLQNSLDRRKCDRLKSSIHAAKHRRKFSDVTMSAIYAKRLKGASYKELMKEFNISSKGTLSYMINTKYKTITEI